MSTSSPADHPLPLDRLNAAERTVLALLAEGHTAKSIAAQTGRTVGAVNERLREARRKTGVGSSRELARLLKAQEVRDEQIGVPPSPQPAEAVPAGAMGLRVHKGWLLMLGIGLLGTAALLALEANPVAPVNPYSSTLSWPEQPSVRALHDQLDKEVPDPGWAPSTEARLREAYATHKGLADVTVRCGRSLCEVFGRIDRPTTRMNAVLQDLQGPLQRSISTTGLTLQDASFTAERLFVMYWKRGGSGE